MVKLGYERGMVLVRQFVLDVMVVMLAMKWLVLWKEWSTGSQGAKKVRW